MTNKWFTNWTDEVFTYQYNSEDFHFAPGESKLLPAYLAEHFGKHLTDKVLHAGNKTVNDASRVSLENKCFAVPEDEVLPMVEEQSPIKAEIEVLNTIAPKKRGRPAKKAVESEKFDGLNEAVSV